MTVEIAVPDDLFADVSPALATSPVPKPKTAAGHKGVLYFDLETVPDYERMASFGLDPIPEPMKRSIYGEFAGQSKSKEGVLTDQLKGTLKEFETWIRKWNPDNDSLEVIDRIERSAPKPRKGIFDLTEEIRNQDSAREQLLQDHRKKMSVTPEFNRIVAMGWRFNGETMSTVIDYDVITEETLLELFWGTVRNCKSVCGYNILGFDLPTIFVRSILLDVCPSRTFDLKPWGTDVIDLMKKRFPSSGSMKLKTLAACMGIPIPAGDVDGSQVEELWKNDPKKLGEYVRSDVDLCAELHSKYFGFFC
jgi:hypothetical protein